MDTKHCKKCGQTKDVSEFPNSRARKDGKHPYCKACNGAVARQWVIDNKERALATRLVYQAGRRDIINSQKRVLRQKYKLECLLHYSNGTLACACCGESTIQFLSLDHINNDGAAHRKEAYERHGNGKEGYRNGKNICGDTMYRLLAHDGYPDVGLQVLCFNCNQGKRINGGVCPHISEKGSTTRASARTPQANGGGSTGRTAH